MRCSHAIASHYLVFHAAFVRPDDLVQRVGKLCGEKLYDLSHQRKKRIIVEQIEDENANSGKKREKEKFGGFRGERASGARLKERVNRRRLKISVNKKKKKETKGAQKERETFVESANTGILTKDGAYFYHQSWFVIEFDYHSQL